MSTGLDRRIDDLLAHPRPAGRPDQWPTLDDRVRRLLALDRHGQAAERLTWRDVVAAIRREHGHPRDRPPTAGDRLRAAMLLSHGLNRGILEPAPGPRGGAGWRVRPKTET